MASGRLLICIYSSWGFWHVRGTYANTEKHTHTKGPLKCARKRQEEEEEAEHSGTPLTLSVQAP